MEHALISPVLTAHPSEVRRKSVINTMASVVAIAALVSLLWFAVSYSIAFTPGMTRVTRSVALAVRQPVGLQGNEGAANDGEQAESDPGRKQRPDRGRHRCR